MFVCSMCKEKTAREQVMGANSAAVMHMRKKDKGIKETNTIPDTISPQSNNYTTIFHQLA